VTFRAVAAALVVSLLVVAGCSGGSHSSTSASTSSTSGGLTNNSGDIVDPDAAGSGTVDTTPVQGVNERHDVHYGPDDHQVMDVYTPDGGGAPRPAVIVIHGGGWSTGSKNLWRHQGVQLAQAGIVAFAIDYRLAPASHFPGQLEDAQAALQDIRQHAGDYGVEHARIGALGGSAGGHLAALLATTGSGPLDTGTRIKAAVSWSGPMDLRSGRDPGGTEKATNIVNRFLGCKPATCADLENQASPIAQIDPTDAPILLVTAERDKVDPQQAKDMGAALSAAGVANRVIVVPGAGHSSSYGDEVWGDTLAWFQQHL